MDLSHGAVPRIYVPKSKTAREHYRINLEVHVFIKGEVLQVETRSGGNVCGKGNIKFN